MDSRKILIVEDEEDIIELVTFNLGKEGFQVKSVTNGIDAVSKVLDFQPNLILLDLMLPGADGLEVCRQLKGNPDTQNIPIIIVSAKTEETDIVTGLELGAEDFVTKPFSPKVLVSRIKAVLRRVAKQPSPKTDTITVQGLEIIPSRREVKLNGEPISLTYSEFEALHLLARRPGWVFTRYQIVETIHGSDYAVTDRAIDVLIVSLRKKLGDFASNIETIRGVGYRFKD